MYTILHVPAPGPHNAGEHLTVAARVDRILLKGPRMVPNSVTKHQQ
jgi:hypothetical protein